MLAPPPVIPDLHPGTFREQRTRTYINATGIYLPQQVVNNDHFSRITGRPVEWFEQVTGIVERRRANAEETTDSMALLAVDDLRNQGTVDPGTIDLIVGASYTPHDTIATHAHVVQRHLAIRHARVMTVSAACSSLINALEIASLFIDSGRARNALVVASEHNSKFATDSDERSGHLWGDGAVAMVVSRDPHPGGFALIDVHTAGLACVGQGPAAIGLRIRERGIVMEHSRDVFNHACRSMVEAAKSLLRENGIGMADIQLLVPHQANKRILDRVAYELELPADRVAMPLRTLGNTGCASVGIAFHLSQEALRNDDRALLLTFGGGYSVGAALIQRA